MRTGHMLLKATVGEDHLRSQKKLEEFLDKLVSELRVEPVHGPAVAKRRGSHPGMSGIFISHDTHVVVHAFPKENRLSMTLFSASPVNADSAREALARHYEIERTAIQFAEFSDRLYEKRECEMPGCARAATEERNGKLVCADCGDQLRDANVADEDFWR